MNFPNAAKGISKIYTAEILALIAAIAAIVGLISAQVGVSAESGGLAIGGIIFVIATPILLLISFIMNIIGVNAASKDEEAFKTALYAIIIGIIVSVVSAIFPNSNLVKGIADTVSKVCELLVTWYCITGIGNLAVKLGNNAVKEKADKLLKLIIAIYVIAIILTLVASIFKGNVGTTIAAVLGIAAAVCSIISYIMYLGLLSKGKQMLNN